MGYDFVVFAVVRGIFAEFGCQCVVFAVVRGIFAEFGCQCVVFAVVRGIFAEWKTVVRIVCGVSACCDVFCQKDQKNHLT